MELAKNFIDNIISSIAVTDILDIAIVTYIIYKVICFIRETRAEQLAKGLLVLVAVTLLSEVLHLYTLHWMLSSLMTVGLIAIVVIFQPELRRALEHLGRSNISNVLSEVDQEEAMSISDLIVVMKDGEVHQIGKPQDVYDSPVNLFVATFLGTPPINVFSGSVKGGKVYIGSEAICGAPGVADQLVHVAIRPEGFVLDAEGPLTFELDEVEVMGRDITVVSKHPLCRNAEIRSIIDSENAADVPAGKVHFSVKPFKVFLFEQESEKRIDAELV